MEKETSLSPWYGDFIPRNQIPISKPLVEGFFSIDAKMNYINSAINLKYLKLPKTEKINFDLNEGYNAVIKKPEKRDPKIDHLLQFILHNKGKLIRNSKESSLINTDFICYRGLLRLIMCMPYERIDDWSIFVTKYKGNIYLCQKETEAKTKRIAEESENVKKNCSYGFKFEQFILVDSPGHIPNTKCPVNECEEFSCVFKTKLGNFKLFYGADIDGINSPHEVDISSVDPEKLEFIKVKVWLKNTDYRRQLNFFRLQFRNWWCQNFLVGINNIYIGFRNEDGIVKEIDTFTLERIAELGKNYWSPIVCLDFLHKFLAMVQKIVENNDCPYSVYEFYWDPKTRKNISYKFHKGKTELTFLPDWYINEFEN